VGLSANVSVDTNIYVTVYYKQAGRACNNPSFALFSTSFTVYVAQGESTGNIDECNGGSYVPGGATVCYTCVTGTDNTVDNIIFNNPPSC
jgi:hypothetical protein